MWFYILVYAVTTCRVSWLTAVDSELTANKYHRFGSFLVSANGTTATHLSKCKPSCSTCNIFRKEAVGERSLVSWSSRTWVELVSNYSLIWKRTFCSSQSCFLCCSVQQHSSNTWKAGVHLLWWGAVVLPVGSSLSNLSLQKTLISNLSANCWVAYDDNVFQILTIPSHGYCNMVNLGNCKPWLIHD